MIHSYTSSLLGIVLNTMTQIRENISKKYCSRDMFIIRRLMRT